MILSETSAKTGDGIQELFKQIAERIAKIKKWTLSLSMYIKFIHLT